MKSFALTINLPVKLGEQEINAVFNARLEELTDGLFLQDADLYGRKAGIYRIVDTGGRHLDHELVSEDLGDPKHAIEVAAYRLKQLLKNADKQ
jgi:hypothetical protein